MAVCSLPAPVRVRSLLPDCGKLTLRIHGRGHEQRLVRIQSARCTVGSAAGCTLRLRSAGVAPLACWILRGKCGAVVRRMHGAATLNGGALEEAPLQAGDRLRIGAVELEVVECRESQPESVSESLPPSVLTAELEARLAAALEKISHLEGEMRQGFQSSIVAADRADQMRDALAAAHQQLEEACRELAASQETLTHQSAELDDYRRQLDEARAAHGHLSEQLVTANQQQVEAVEARRQREAELDDYRRQLDEARAAHGNLSEQIVTANQHQAEAAEARRQREADIAILQSQLAAVAIEKSRQADAVDELQRNLAQQQEECSRLTATISEGERRLSAETERWRAERTQFEQRILQREAALQALRDHADSQTGVMTIQMGQLQADANATHEHWQIQCDVLEGRIADLQAEFIRREDEWRQLRDQMQQQAVEQAAALQQEVAQREGAGQAQAELIQQQAQLATWQEELDRARQELTGARQNLENDRQQLAAEREQAETQRQQLAAEQERLASQGVQLTSDREQVTSERTQLDAERRELEAARQQQEIEREQLAASGAASAEALQQDVAQREGAGQAQAELQQQQARLATWQEELDRARQELTGTSQNLENDRQQLAAEREQAETQRQQLAAEQERLASQTVQLTSDREQVASERTQLAAARRELEAARQQREIERQDVATSGEAAAEDLRQRENLLQQKTAQFDLQLQAATDRLAELDALGARLAGERAAMDERNQRLDEREQALQAREAPAAVPPNRQPELPPAAEAVHPANVTARWQSPEELAAAESPAGEISAVVVAASAEENPADAKSVESVLSRLVRAGVWRDGAPQSAEQPGEPGAAAVAPAGGSAAEAPSPAPVATIAEGADSASDDESIELYMDRLLKRVRGDSPANAGGWKQPTADQAATPAPVPAAPSETALKKEECLPRSTVPEQVSNLSAMRELANDAARHAIERHIRKHTGKQATGKLLAAGLTVAASLVLAYWAWKGHSLRAALGALMGAGIGIYWTIGAIRRIANVMRLNRPQPQTELPVDAIMEITADSSSPAPQETHSV